MTTEQLNDLVHERLKDIMEHFDAVQFLGSFTDDKGHTLATSIGCGNWYARQGLAHEFITTDQARTQAHEIKLATQSEE